MSELVAFLEARLAEDEAVARKAMFVVGDDMADYRIGEWWEKPEHGRVCAGHWHKVVEAGVTLSEPPIHNTAALPHVARHDPACVLREVTAKRTILARCVGHLSGGGGYDEDAELARFVLRREAEVYKDHPDFRDFFPGWPDDEDDR